MQYSVHLAEMDAGGEVYRLLEPITFYEVLYVVHHVLTTV